MCEIEGYWDVIPRIKDVSFPIRGKMQIDLQDGRIIIVSVSRFPSVKRLSMEQRKKWYILGNGFSFEDSDEVIHIEQILGNFANYAHEA
ncbi:MAG: DUF2442 domain-containing protein [Bacteroidales bacterium]|nr:DUF2442 domain-containing protein [Bacteroidales bacterium]